VAISGAAGVAELHETTASGEHLYHSLHHRFSITRIYLRVQATAGMRGARCRVERSRRFHLGDTFIRLLRQARTNALRDV